GAARVAGGEHVGDRGAGRRRVRGGPGPTPSDKGASRRPPSLREKRPLLRDIRAPPGGLDRARTAAAGPSRCSRPSSGRRTPSSALQLLLLPSARVSVGPRLRRLASPSARTRRRGGPSHSPTTGWYHEVMTKSLQDTYAPRNKCFGCGPANEKGLRIKSFVEGEEVVATFRPEDHHQAF